MKYHILWSSGSFSVGSFDTKEEALNAAITTRAIHPRVRNLSFLILNTEEKEKFIEIFNKIYGKK